MRTFLFIFGLLLILALGLLLKNKGIIFTSESEGIGSHFTPDELATFDKSYDVNKFAGICETRHFLRFSDKNNATYTYYYLTKSNVLDDNESYCNEHATEKIHTDRFAKSISYTIRNEQVYSGFVKYLLENKVQPPAELANLSDYQNDDTSYIINDVLFFDRGYQIDDNGYTFYVVPLSDYLSAHQPEPKADTIVQEKPKRSQSDETKIDSSVAYISVNEATVYENTNFILTQGSLKKGSKLNIVRQADDAYYCDYVDSYGNAGTGWIKDIDISFKKPKKVFNPIQEDSVSSSSDN